MPFQVFQIFTFFPIFQNFSDSVKFSYFLRVFSIFLNGRMPFRTFFVTAGRLLQFFEFLHFFGFSEFFQFFCNDRMRFVTFRKIFWNMFWNTLEHFGALSVPPAGHIFVVTGDARGG